LGQLVFTEEAIHGGKTLMRFGHEQVQRFIAVANLYAYACMYIRMVLRLFEEIRYAANIINVGQ
jgi:hypothetical protein